MCVCICIIIIHASLHMCNICCYTHKITPFGQSFCVLLLHPQFFSSSPFLLSLYYSTRLHSPLTLYFSPRHPRLLSLYFSPHQPSPSLLVLLLYPFLSSVLKWWIPCSPSSSSYHSPPSSYPTSDNELLVHTGGDEGCLGHSNQGEPRGSQPPLATPKPHPPHIIDLCN